MDRGARRGDDLGRKYEKENGASVLSADYKNSVLVPCYLDVWDSNLGCAAEGLSWFFSVRDDKLHLVSIQPPDIGYIRPIS